MFINYEYENHVYNVEVEKKEEGKYLVTYDNNTYTVEAEELKPGQIKIKVGDRYIKCVVAEGKNGKFVFIDGDVFKVKPVPLTGRKKMEKKEGNLSSPISGKVVRVNVKKGDAVKKGDVLMVIEAMKMEYLIKAPYDGTVKNVNFKEKDQIELGEITVEVEKTG
ncbi:MAG TPA: biotin/lipoyl-binding protein [Thermoplasmatales archaeon]|nr:biotin/lipoyl-binding protein [Thermoplasmatales archaeon]